MDQQIINLFDEYTMLPSARCIYQAPGKAYRGCCRRNCYFAMLEVNMQKQKLSGVMIDEFQQKISLILVMIAR